MLPDDILLDLGVLILAVICPISGRIVRDELIRPRNSLYHSYQAQPGSFIRLANWTFQMPQPDTTVRQVCPNGDERPSEPA